MTPLKSMSRSAAMRSVGAVAMTAATMRAAVAADLLTDVVRAAKNERELVLVAGSDTFGGSPGMDALNDLFNRRFKLDARISLTPGPSMPAMASRLATEYKGNRSATTGIYHGPVSQFAGLDRDGVLMRVDWVRTFPWIPPAAVLSSTGTGVLVRTGPNAMVYNPKYLPASQAPKRYEDLVDTNLNGPWNKRLAIPPYPDFLAGLTLVWGVDRTREFARKLVAVSGGQLRYGDAEALIDGQFAIMANDGGALEMKWLWEPKGVAFNVVFGSNPTYSDYFQLGVPKNSGTPNLAQLFTAFMVTREAQMVINKVGQGSHLVPGTRMADYLKANRVRLIAPARIYDFYAAPGTAALYSELGSIIRA